MITTISIWDVFLLLFFHWVGDFVMQSDKDAKGKSTSWVHLLSHTLSYTICFLPIVLAHGDVRWFLFMPITFVAHTATDYYTSRVNSQLYNEGKIHDYFVSIGFDQLLHFAQLIITFQILKQL